MKSERVQIVDSHTGGEPTRVVLSGGPDLGAGPLSERLALFRDRHDTFRSAVVCEPRGSDVLVGALLCQPTDPTCTAGVIFFNNVGYLGMCGHGAIGFVITLGHLGRIQPGALRLETPVGLVEAEWHGGAEVSVHNVPSRRRAAGVVVEVPGLGTVTGDIVWAGNWFYLVKASGLPLTLAYVEDLTATAWAIRRAVNAAGYPEVDHIELFGLPQAGGHSRSFVLCPGKAYDRSPCGTGTSAKLACLAADDQLAEGEPWVQESIIGSQFRASYRWLNRDAGTIVPTIRGTAYVTAEATLLLGADDPFRHGIR